LQQITNDGGATMNDINAVLAGRIEDKWIEFVAAEFRDLPRQAGGAGTRRQRAQAGFAFVEVQASYLWLFAGALLAWFIS
jgi:hypothetical protein